MGVINSNSLTEHKPSQCVGSKLRNESEEGGHNKESG